MDAIRAIFNSFGNFPADNDLVSEKNVSAFSCYSEDNDLLKKSHKDPPKTGKAILK